MIRLRDDEKSSYICTYVSQLYRYITDFCISKKICIQVFKKKMTRYDYIYMHLRIKKKDDYITVLGFLSIIVQWILTKACFAVWTMFYD